MENAVVTGEDGSLSSSKVNNLGSLEKFSLVVE